VSLTTVDSGLISSGAITLTTQVTGTLPEANGGTGTTTGYYGFKNRIINGAMVIDQRNAGASVSVQTSITYLLDRCTVAVSQSSKFTAQQNAGAITPAVGFGNYLGITSTSAYSVLAADYFIIGQYIEGFNFSDMAWGTASASAVTLSFKVYSSLTGTFGGSLQNSAFNRSYPFTYSIPTANTWTTISVTVAGDTSGTWIGNTNGVGLRVWFSLGMGTTYSGTAGAWAGATYYSATGATSVVGTNGATFYITGVQLEKGSTATSFDYRPYGTELALCQRYYTVFGNNGAYSGAFGSGYSTSTTAARLQGNGLPVVMRTAPTMTFSSQTDFAVLNVAGNQTTTALATLGVSASSFSLTATTAASTQVAGQGVLLSDAANATAQIRLSAEL